MYESRPIDKARVGRLVLAALDQDHGRLTAVVAEALNENTLLELFDTLGGAFIGLSRLTIGEDKFRQWASDWVLHAQAQAEGVAEP